MLVLYRFGLKLLAHEVVVLRRMVLTVLDLSCSHHAIGLPRRHLLTDLRKVQGVILAPTTIVIESTETLISGMLRLIHPSSLWCNSFFAAHGQNMRPRRCIRAWLVCRTDKLYVSFEKKSNLRPIARLMMGRTSGGGKAKQVSF